MRLAWRFKLIPFLATLVLVVLGIALGNWQTRRAEEKLALGALLAQRSAAPPLELGSNVGGPAAGNAGATAVAATAAASGTAAAPGTVAGSTADLAFRRVRVTGNWVPGWPVLLDNRPHEGRVGFILGMPFRIAGSDRHLLVLRGWLPRDARDYARVPPFVTPAGTVQIEGIVTASAGHILQLGTPAALTPGARVQNLAPDELARASGLALAPYFVQQEGDGQPEGLLRDWPAPALGVDKHRGYAFQWYALAAMAALFFVMTGFRRASKQGE